MTDAILGCQDCRTKAWDVDVYLCEECDTLWRPWTIVSEPPPKGDLEQ
jgi:hypothetical protein